MVTRLESAQATRQALNALAASGELRQYQLIHIASHAQLSAAHGLLGHIKLADDDLLVDEVLRLGLGGALVVLAACEGAAGEVLPGDEVLGIGRALLAAGAATVVASLWPIYDLAVPHMLDDFYDRLVGGDDAALALAYAQRALIALADVEHPHAGDLAITVCLGLSVCHQRRDGLRTGGRVVPRPPRLRLCISRRRRHRSQGPPGSSRSVAWTAACAVRSRTRC